MGMHTKEAIERVRTRFNKWALDNEDLAALQVLGLVDADNEDERIRKCIVEAIRQCTDILDPKNQKRMLDWLERQRVSFDAISSWLRDHASNYVNSEFNEFHHCVEYDGTINVEKLIADLKAAVDGSIFDVDAKFDAREPRDNWEYVKEFCDKFGRMPKDMDELDVLVSYVMDKRQKELPTNEEMLRTLRTEYEKGVADTIAKYDQIPIFRVGDTIIAKDGTCIPKEPFHIERIEDGCYWDGDGSILICHQDDFQLIDQKPVERSREDSYIIGFVYALLNQIEWKDNWAMSKEECLRRLNNYCPHKPAEWSEKDEDFINMLILHFNHLIDKGGDSVEAYKSYREKLKSLRPQPKQEWSEEDKETIEKTICILETNFKPNEGFTGLDINRSQLVDRLSSLRPQPKQEWSEEDKKMLKIALDNLEELEQKYGENYGRVGKCMEWIELLPERFNLQPKQEWSDDDKTRLKVITEELERFIMFRNYGTPLSVDDIEWLKNLPERFNLQLKQERSEEDKTTLECSDQFKRFVDMVHSADKDEFTEFEWSIINFALACGDKNIAMTPKGIHCYAKTILDVVKKDFPPQISGWADEEETVLHYACEFIRHRLNDSTCRNGSIGGMDYKELYEKLKSLRPAWKPSEEQMKWLKDVIETVPMTCRQQVPLESLYADLKKL